MPRHTPVPPVIDIPSRSGVRGRIDKLAQEYLTKAQALRIAAEILDDDDRKTAQQLGPKRFLQAMTLRAAQSGLAEEEAADAPVVKTSHKKKPTIVRKSDQERRAEMREYLSAHSGATTNEIADGLGVSNSMALKYANRVGKPREKRRGGPGIPIHWVLRGAALPSKPVKAAKPVTAMNGVERTKKGKPRKQSASSWFEKPKINGPRMTLFLLENLAESKPHTASEMAEQLAAAGSPIKSLRILNAPLGGTCAKFGYIKTAKEGGYLLTAKGKTHMTQLRQQLEADGTVQVGGYFPA